MTLTLDKPADEPSSNTKIEVVYRAQEGDPPTTAWRGKSFIVDKPVLLDPQDETEAGIIEAARGNPSFDVGGESKAELRAEAARNADRERAEVELARLEGEAEALEKQQTQEMNALEAEHQRERDAFMNTNQATMEALRATIRGSDGHDDLHPVEHADDGHDLDPDGKPATGGTPGAPETVTEPTSAPAPNPAPQPETEPTVNQ